MTYNFLIITHRQYSIPFMEFFLKSFLPSDPQCNDTINFS